MLAPLAVARRRGAPLLRALALAATLAAAVAMAAPAAPPPAPAAAQPPPGEPADAAQARLRAGDVAGALALLETAAAAPQPTVETRLLLARLYLEGGRAADAWALLAPLAAGPAADPQVRYDAARAALAAGRKRDAEALLVDLVGRDPLSRAAVLLAELRHEDGRSDDAAGLLAPLATEPAASAIERQDPAMAARIAYGYGRALVAAGRGPEALPHLERAVRLDPDHAAAWRLLGERLVAAERLDEAQAALARAHELEERRHAAQVAATGAGEAAQRQALELARQAAAARSAGRPQDALPLLRRAAELVPRNPAWLILEVQVLVDLGRHAEALPRAETLVAMAPDLAEAHYLSGMVRLAAGQPTAAEAPLRRALELDGRHLGAMNGLALALAATDRVAEARQLLERALALFPQDPLARRHLDRLRAQADPPPSR